MTPDYKLVAFDMDGTLLDGSRDLQPGTRRAFQAMRDAGTRIMLASGRPVPGLKLLATRLILGDNLVLAGMNGAEVVDLATGREIARHPLPMDTVRALLAAAREHDVLVMIPHGHELIVEDTSHPQVALEASGNDLTVRQVADLQDLAEEPVKIVFVGERSVAQPLKDRLTREQGDSIELAYSSPLYLEATARGVHKGSAITDYCAAEGISLDQVMAFGDNGNDVGMLRAAGLGVAMGNGIPEAKSAADVVTTSNNHEGIARILHKYFDFDFAFQPAPGSDADGNAARS